MRKAALLFATTALAVLLASGVAWAAAGDLDPTFGGGDGVVVNTQASHFGKTEVLSDGKIIVFGGRGTKGLLMRYNEDGTVDTTFGGGDGKVWASAPPGSLPPDTRWGTFLLQPDGKLVVTGAGNGPDADDNLDVILRRFNPDGSLDVTFGGGDGTTVARFPNHRDAHLSALILRREKIVGVGTLSAAEDPAHSDLYPSDMLVMRFKLDGSTDKTFGGGDGRVLVDFPGGNNYGAAVAMIAGGKLLAAGGQEDETEPLLGSHHYYNFTLARLYPDGTLDQTFGGGDGKVVTDFGWSDTGTEIVVREGGRPVVVGTTERHGEWSAFVLAAYNSDGSLDKTFGGGDGRVVGPSGNCYGSHASDAVNQASGKIIVVGKAGCSDFFTLVRYLPSSGALDESFGGGDGMVETSPYETAIDADLAPGGKLVVAGIDERYHPVAEEDVNYAALLRYLLE